MKILVMSDSHGDINSCLAAVRKENPELILHLGDHDTDALAIAKAFPKIPVKSVKGNCDPASAGEVQLDFKLLGKKFIMTHGHVYGVKSGLESILHMALENNTDVLLFGHTHIAFYEVWDKAVIVNPGSVMDKKYAVLEIKNGEVICELI